MRVKSVEGEKTYSYSLPGFIWVVFEEVEAFAFSLMVVIFEGVEVLISSLEVLKGKLREKREAKWRRREKERRRGRRRGEGKGRKVNRFGKIVKSGWGEFEGDTLIRKKQTFVLAPLLRISARRCSFPTKMDTRYEGRERTSSTDEFEEFRKNITWPCWKWCRMRRLTIATKQEKSYLQSPRVYWFTKRHNNFTSLSVLVL